MAPIKAACSGDGLSLARQGCQDHAKAGEPD